MSNIILIILILLVFIIGLGKIVNDQIKKGKDSGKNLDFLKSKTRVRVLYYIFLTIFSLIIIFGTFIYVASFRESDTRVDAIMIFCIFAIHFIFGLISIRMPILKQITISFLMALMITSASITMVFTDFVIHFGLSKYDYWDIIINYFLLTIFSWEILVLAHKRFCKCDQY